MLFGITGAAGTGKSTLGRLAGERTGIPFVPTSITRMARDVGYDAVSPMTLRERLDMQEKMLLKMAHLMNTMKGHAILDRTPIDMIGYMLGEVGMHSDKDLTPEELLRIEQMIVRCKRLTMAMFDFVFVTTPLPNYETKDTRPPPNRPYQWHTQFIMQGALMECSHRLSNATLIMSDLNERVDYVSGVILERIQQAEVYRATASHIH